MTRLREQEPRVAAPHAVWRPVSFADVTIDDQFWAPRLQLNRERTIPFQYKQLRETGRLDALRLDWRPGQEPVPHIFWDSDVAKWIEAASYSLATHPDSALDALVDETIALLASAQQPDGYLNTYFTVVKPGQRWTDLRDAHELYCAGHLIEAGVAHYKATGKRALLDV
ncbi:MAG: glycoside hydrolase family 127 protein, partial [Chloroflexi bacterium]|nr:glycoside hydrolase family 127 protein [Chloroflexota bacterium]